jgi:hypothetical protein
MTAVRISLSRHTTATSLRLIGHPVSDQCDSNLNDAAIQLNGLYSDFLAVLQCIRQQALSQYAPVSQRKSKHQTPLLSQTSTRQMLSGGS